MEIAIIPLLLVFYKLNNRYKKKYCFPSQLKIVELLGKYQNIERSVRTLNRWLKFIEDKHFIKRTRRIRRDPELGYIFKSTLYKITKKGYLQLWRAGIDCFDKIKNLSGGVKKTDYQENKSPRPVNSPGEALNKKKMREIWNGVKNKISNTTTLFNL